MDFSRVTCTATGSLIVWSCSFGQSQAMTLVATLSTYIVSEWPLLVLCGAVA